MTGHAADGVVEPVHDTSTPPTVDVLAAAARLVGAVGIGKSLSTIVTVPVDWPSVAPTGDDRTTDSCSLLSIATSLTIVNANAFVAAPGVIVVPENAIFLLRTAL